MNRGVLFVALLLLVVGVIGFQTGAYLEFERLFTKSSTATHPASGNGSSGSTGNDSNSNGNNHGTNSNSTRNSDYIQANTIINYGNGTITWFNWTNVPKGLNFYSLTLLLAHGDVNSTFYSSWNPPEHFITGINHVLATSTYYWSLWSFCANEHSWQYAEVGADDIQLSDHGIYGWYYQTGTSPPVTGAASLPIGSVCST